MITTATPPRQQQQREQRLRAAFTLVEMLIALSLGLVIVITVVAGMRVASQTFTLVNRLAQENQMMRVGCEVAHDHLDFWTDLDDPEGGASHQTLRASDPGGGLPFTPMASIALFVSGAGGRESDTGWNPAEAWSAADPRIWWHGNLGENFSTNLMLGRYSIFTNSSQNLTIGATPSAGAYGTVSVLHNWLNNQLWTLSSALGYYGYLDYTPANTPYQCYMAYTKDVTNDDGQPLTLGTPGGDFANNEGGQRYPLDLYRLTMGTAIGLVGPMATDATKSKTHQHYYYLDYAYSDQAVFDKFNSETANRAPLLTGDGPANWPRVTVSMQRFVKTNRFVNICRVVLTSPLTGDHAQLVWDGIGSTLRGARLQRDKTEHGGWATWDNATTALVNASPTLDDQ